MLDEVTLDLSGITAIKADKQELAALAGGLEQFEATGRASIRLLYKQIHYRIKVNRDNYNYADTDDILSAAFCCSYKKERDPLWAICFATGALRAALKTGSTDLNKIPTRNHDA